MLTGRAAWVFAMAPLLAACPAEGRKTMLGEPATQETAAARQSASAEVPQESSWAAPDQQELQERRKALSPEQFRITQQGGTERAFGNEYWNQHEDGIYVDVVSGEPLFSSKDKFDSGTGWPSFSRPLVREQVVERTDRSLGMDRTEVQSSVGGTHLGHVFPDGPGPEGTRYCINSASLRFIPAARLKAEGYGRFASMFPDVKQIPPAAEPSFPDEAREAALVNRAGVAANLEVAVLAGGCFWGMEELFRTLEGVVSTEVGYAGGDGGRASYDQVKTGSTGHAESLKVVFDPARVSYERVIAWFFRIHDPTTPNRQGNDIGTQYRSAIFYQSSEQARVALAVKSKLDASGVLGRPVATQVVPAKRFYSAEAEHQDYLQRNPGGYTCHFVRPYEL